MAIERMKLLSITGKEGNIDDFIIKYLLDSVLQPEDAIKVLDKGWNLVNFDYDSRPKELKKECEKILNELHIKYDSINSEVNLLNSVDEIEEKISNIKDEFNILSRKIKEKEDEIIKVEHNVSMIEHLKGLNLYLEQLYNLKYVKFRYGKISKENYNKLLSVLSELNAILIKVEDDKENENFVWVICFTTHKYTSKVDGYLNVLKFERVWIPREIVNKPNNFVKESTRLKKNILREVENEKNNIEILKDKYTNELKNIYLQLKLYKKINSIKKYMAHDENGSFYIIGWLPTVELKKIIPKLDREENVKFIIKNHDEVASVPPTKLKNNFIVRPFEMIVKMYGLPNYTELDPTWFVALTACLLFGFMFGDVGHGLVFFIIGVLLKRKKIELGPIMQMGGIFSIIFGIIYGSVFGLENIIPAIIIRPMENITTMLIYGIAVGVIFIFMAMVLNVINGIKNKDKKRIFLDVNGIAGIFFYAVILITAVYFLLKGKMLMSLTILLILLITPLMLIMFKNELSKKIFKDKNTEKSSLVEKVFEIIETLLSFASNTISFVRIAAFAINHVGLCMAIYILSDMLSTTGSIAVAIIGNMIVIVLEGLIVGIQVLRLEYYELFSRFYKGNGREYKPLRENI